MGMAESKALALEPPRPEPMKSSLRDAYMAEVLGDVAKILDRVSELQSALPALEHRLETIFNKASLKLATAESDAVVRVRAAGETAGAVAVERAVGEQVKVLVGRMALASDDLRATADKASAGLRQAVEKVSVWRQIGFCAGSGAVSAIVVVLSIWLVWGRGSAEGCPATLSPQQCDTYQQGVAIQAMWPHLPANIQEYLKAVHNSVE